MTNHHSCVSFNMGMVKGVLCYFMAIVMIIIITICCVWWYKAEVFRVAFRCSSYLLDLPLCLSMAIDLPCPFHCSYPVSLFAQWSGSSACVEGFFIDWSCVHTCSKIKEAKEKLILTIKTFYRILSLILSARVASEERCMCRVPPFKPYFQHNR